MGDRKKQFGVRGRPPDPLADRILPSGDTAPPFPATASPCQECLNAAKYDELLKQEQANLLRIAAARIRNTCSDPNCHKQDVVQQGVLKFWRAAKRRDAEYENPAKILRGAVWQEGVRHSQTCGREQAINFEGLDERPQEPGAPDPNGHEAGELIRKTSFNPVELYNVLLDLEQKLNGADEELFIMHFMEGWNPAEIAARRGCSPSTVRRAIEKLEIVLGWAAREEAPSTDQNS